MNILSSLNPALHSRDLKLGQKKLRGRLRRVKDSEDEFELSSLDLEERLKHAREYPEDGAGYDGLI